MDELRRSLRMMQEDFDLVATLSEYCEIASERTGSRCAFPRTGRERAVGPESALALFRVLQEASPTWRKHAGKERWWR